MEGYTIPQELKDLTLEFVNDTDSVRTVRVSMLSMVLHSKYFRKLITETPDLLIHKTLKVKDISPEVMASFDTFLLSRSVKDLTITAENIKQFLMLDAINVLLPNSDIGDYMSSITHTDMFADHYKLFQKLFDHTPYNDNYYFNRLGHLIGTFMVSVGALTDDIVSNVPRNCVYNFVLTSPWREIKVDFEKQMDHNHDIVVAYFLMSKYREKCAKDGSKISDSYKCKFFDKYVVGTPMMSTTNISTLSNFNFPWKAPPQDLGYESSTDSEGSQDSDEDW